MQLSASLSAPCKKNRQVPHATRVEAPKVGGPKREAVPLAVPQESGQNYIDLSDLCDSGSEGSGEPCGEPESEVPVAAAAKAKASAMAAGAGAGAVAAAERSSSARPMKYPPRGHPLNPVVPTTIESLWSEVETLYDRRLIDQPLCKAGDCPFCTGPLMQQRHDLMQRLVVLEKMLWLGDKTKGDK